MWCTYVYIDTSKFGTVDLEQELLMLEGQKASGTMAGAAGEITPSTSQEEDPSKVTFEEPKGEKKKKFNPLEKMRKFFRSSKKQSKSKDVTQSKSRSTGALHQSTTSDDEDDGGIFNPEQKEANLEALRKTAVSMEAINQDFKGRAHSESNYGYSPTQPMTTADIVMGSRLKV
ncbi:hypothetical protein KUTeg_024533 [Tegillarca granosa]|uniref:Uncharacterized protein n=1 Tax=Tegillarca granosa TaxID=220873 RepID=A0ABQ9E348_TEGGR|nr:hypothetical protein KUTeg_024533 [Tegillarca granosa]